MPKGRQSKTKSQAQALLDEARASYAKYHESIYAASHDLWARSCTCVLCVPSVGEGSRVDGEARDDQPSPPSPPC